MKGFFSLLSSFSLWQEQSCVLEGRTCGILQESVNGHWLSIVQCSAFLERLGECSFKPYVAFDGNGQLTRAVVVLLAVCPKEVSNVSLACLWICSGPAAGYGIRSE